MEAFQCRHLARLDAALVGLYINACVNEWAKLPPLAKEFYAAGGTVEQLRGCLRHLIVLAGYGPCLAANLTLQKAKLLPHDTPAKIGGPPGDAFELVYTTVTTAVRRKVHSSDPALGEWIRLHLYGDVYSSPGLDLRRKQLLMCARLAQANMGEQLFGHAFAAMRFGATREELEEAVALAFDISPVKGRGTEAAHVEALKILSMSAAKFQKDFDGVPEPLPEPTIPDLSTLKIPKLYLGENTNGTPVLTSTATNVINSASVPVKPSAEPVVDPQRIQVTAAAAPPLAEVELKSEQPTPAPRKKQEKKRIVVRDEAGDDDGDVAFAWEEIDPRIDPKNGRWKE